LLVGLYREQLGKGLHRSKPTNSDEERLKAKIQELEQLLSQLEEIEPNSEND
jgi:cell shape-determining protein MreC